MATLLPVDIDYLKILEIFQIEKSSLGKVESIGIHGDKKGTKGFIGIRDGTIYIQFNGTETWFNWVTNFNFRRAIIPYDSMDPTTKIRVHKGWINLYCDLSVRNAIHYYLAQNKNIKKVVVSGFSMGAAMATLCALDIKYNFPDCLVSCYAFGGPKVGNIHFTDSFNKRVPNHYMIWNGNDIVCRVPPIWTALFNFIVYQHINNVLRIGRKPNVVIPLIDRGVFLNPLKNFKDHYPSEYRKAVLKEIKEELKRRKELW